MRTQLVASMIFVVVHCHAQHIEEIRKKLYPTFDRVQWSQHYIMEQDYTPVDYSQWEVGPNSSEFFDAFIGYHILERFLRKRNNEITAKFDEPSKTAFWNAHRKWEKELKERCEHIWKPEQLGYSMMVLNYLYCLSSGFRTRVDALGGGLPLNSKLDSSQGWEPYKLGSELKSFAGLTSKGSNKKYSFYIPSDSVTIDGAKGAVTLGFAESKLATIVLQFDKCWCEDKVLSHLKQRIGAPSRQDSDHIMEYSTYSWKGKRISMVLFSSNHNVTITIKQITLEP